MKTCSVATILMVAMLLAAGCQPAGGQGADGIDLRVMTFNIRNGLAQDGDNHWRNRKAFVCDVIRQCSPDVLGVQEAYRFQLDEFNQSLPQYGEIGVGREGGVKGEYSAILYRKARFDVDESGTFWLSDTPEKPSITWGNACVRICTWARLTDKISRRSFYVYNTHLDHVSQPSREKSVRLIMKRVQQRQHPDPLILTGDFNAGEGNPVVGYLKAAGKSPDRCPVPLVDSFRAVHPDAQTPGTSSGFQGRTDGPKIDYIFITPDSQAIEADIVRTSRDGRYPSDHFPVTARLRLK
jgi:endonuclease/exonuclease/phosphatase family metal-dependent hydrolase